MALNFGEKFLKYPTAVGRLAIVIINNVYCIPTYVVWMTMLIPLKRFNPQMYYKIEGLFFHWLLAVVTMWSYTAGCDIVEVGDDINECKNKRTLVIANHQSTADVPLLMANFNAKENILPNLMWIMDRLFKYTNFGIVSIIHQDFFIAAGRKNREESIISLREHLKTSFLKLDRKWMVLFPEGGFLRKRRAASQRFAEKNNLPLLEYVTVPRVGAFKAIFDVMCASSSTSSSSSLSSSANINNISDSNENNVNNVNNATATTKLKSSTTPTKTVTSSTTNKNSNLNLNSNNKIKTTKLINNIHDVENTKNNPMEDQETVPLTMDLTSSSSSSTSKLSNGDVSPTVIGTNLNEIVSEISSGDSLLEYVLDITIAYPNGIPLDLPNILHGWRDPCKTHMLYRLYKVSQIPKEENALTQWLYDRFIEKNDLLKNFYNYGKFYTDRTMTTNLIQQDVLRFVLINLFFITSTYLHYQLFCVIYTYCNILVYSVS